MNEVAGTLLGQVPGFVTALVVAYFAYKWQRERRVIDYYWENTSLFRFKSGAPRSVTFLVRDELVGVEGKPTVLDDAQGVAVMIRNSGNALAESITVTVNVPDHCRILGCQVFPEPTQDYAVSAERDAARPSYVRAQIPYLNPKQKVHVALVCTGLNSDDKCTVDIRGRGVIARRLDRPMAVAIAFSPLALLMLLMYLFNPRKLHEWFSEGALNAIGGQVVTRTATIFPDWYYNVGFVILLVIATTLLGLAIFKISPFTKYPWRGD